MPTPPKGMHQAELVDDAAPAAWVARRLAPRGPGDSVARAGRTVPMGFAAYARVFHPAYVHRPDAERPVRWAAVAARFGRVVHPLMQFHRIAGIPEANIYQDPAWGSQPSRGSLPEAEGIALARTLRPFTATPGRCYFALWDGFGFIDESLLRRPVRLKIPGGEDYLLLRGPLEIGVNLDNPGSEQSANLWWPDDRAWCAATGIDFTETLVGGSEPCIAQVLHNPDLEALPITLDADMSCWGDHINPAV